MLVIVCGETHSGAAVAMKELPSSIHSVVGRELCGVLKRGDVYGCGVEREKE